MVNMGALRTENLIYTKNGTARPQQQAEKQMNHQTN